MTDTVEMLRDPALDHDCLHRMRAANEIEINRKTITELVEILKEAEEMVVDWGAYASDYFQKKWHLDEDITKLRAAITKYNNTTKET